MQRLDRIEERGAEVLLEDDTRRCPSDRGAARPRADRGRCSRAHLRHRAPAGGSASETAVLPLKTTDAVDGETPASRATSAMVARRVLMTPRCYPAAFPVRRIDSVRMVRMDAVLTRSQLVRWRTAVFAIFLASGLSIATWACARARHQGTPSTSTTRQLGLMLLAGGIASILGVSVSSVILARFGARRGMLGAMIVFAHRRRDHRLRHERASTRSGVVVAAVLLLWGFGNGAVDVMMNVEGAAIEKQSGKTILPLFHAFFSFGTVIGAGLGVLAIAMGTERLRAPQHHGRPDHRHRLRQHRERPVARDHDWTPRPTSAKRSDGASACSIAHVGMARASHLRARRDHPRHGIRRGRRQRLARARHRRGTRRRARRSAPPGSRSSRSA